MGTQIRHPSSASVLALLASLLIHAAVIAVVSHTVSHTLFSSRRLYATLRASHQSHVAWTTDPSSIRDAGIEKVHQPGNTTPSNYSYLDKTASPIVTVDADEVYLPPELLTTTARPEEEIDLQGESPLEPGFLRMDLWINRDGVVTQIDLEDSEVPVWFTDRIIEKFRQSRFIPGSREEKPVASIFRVEVSF